MSARLGFDVALDQDQLADALGLLEHVGGSATEALRIAMNKATSRTRTLASRTIREQVRLQASYVNERLTVKKASRARLTASVETPSRGLLLSRFSTDPLIAGEKAGWIRPPVVPKGGIRVRVKPSGAAKVVTGDSETRGNKPFYMVINGGKKLAIAARMTGSKKIKVFSGPSLSQVFNGVKDQILPEVADEYSRQVLDAVRYLMLKKLPPDEGLLP